MEEEEEYFYLTQNKYYKNTVFDLISEHALISEPPIFSFFFKCFFFLNLFFERSCHHYKRSLTCNDLRKYRFAPGIDADKVLKAKKKKKKKKKKGGGFAN